MTPAFRQALLKPEFAHLYPELVPGVWETAATLAEHMLVRATMLGRGELRQGDRVLNEEHFEFRGGVEDTSPRSGARARALDTESPPPPDAPRSDPSA